MKQTITLLLIFLLFSCGSSKQGESIHTKNVDFSTEIEGKVYKIDSLKQFHLIYVSNEKKSFKIISKKIGFDSDCKKIQVGSTYKLRVTALLSEAPPSSGNSNIPVPINHLDIARCKKYEDNTEICTEPGISNLYSTTNLNGLCLIKSIK